MELKDRVFTLQPSVREERDFILVGLTESTYPVSYTSPKVSLLETITENNQETSEACVGFAFSKCGTSYQLSPWWLWMNRPDNIINLNTEGTDPKKQAKMFIDDGACFVDLYGIDNLKSFKYIDNVSEFAKYKAMLKGVAKVSAPDYFIFLDEMNEIKEAIMRHGVVSIMVMVYQASFNNAGNSVDGYLAEPKETDTALGYHEMVLYGWDDEQGIWLGQNSWGDKWGKNGFFEMDYGYPIKESMCFMYSTEEHWATEAYYNLLRKGIKLYDMRFDDNITRGEVMQIISRLVGEE